ncbi:hypothetical protein BJX62DRAFT_238883 [Aspergillus germanicus]
MAAPNIDPAFPFFALPPELREEVYRHIFWIYPDHRCHIIRSPPGWGVLSRNTFEINKRSYSKPKDDATYRPREPGIPTLTKQRVHLESARDFLAILHANKTVYEEAVRIFYSETFFVAYDDMCEMTLFLKRIGPRRRKLIRKLAIPFSSPAVKGGIGGSPKLEPLVDQLLHSTHIEIIEIRAHGPKIENICTAP